MLRIALKGALARKLRLGLTAFSIVLGVAFVAGTFVLTDTLNATFDSIFGNATPGTAVVVRGNQAFSASGPGGPADERSLVPDAVLRTVEGVPGVRMAVGDVSGYAQLVYKGKAVVNGQAPNLGLSWVGDSPLSSLHLVGGHPPTGAGEVVIDDKSAAKFHIGVGAQVEAIVQGTTVPATVVGVVRFANGSTLAGATLTAFAPQQAQQLVLGHTGVWSTVRAAAAPGVTDVALRNRVASALKGQHVQVLTEKAYVTDQSNQFKKQLKFFNVLLLVFAFIAVFVAVFIIFNTFTVLVAQRTRELALLRAVGGARRQVILAVLGEAGIVGLVAGAVGILGGIGVAALLRALISSFGGGLTTVSLQVHPRTIVVALLVGFVVTVVASVVPAVRASRIPPIAAMREDFVLPTASLRRRTRLGVVVLVVGIALLIQGVSGGSALPIGIGAVLMFRGVIALAPVLSRPIVGGIGRFFPRVWGMPGRLARENALRNPRRTAATASALMIGIALTTAMSILFASITTSAGAAIDQSVGADFIITAQHFAPMSDTVATHISGVPGVGAVTSFRGGAMKVRTSTVQVTGVTAATVGQTLRLTALSGTLDSLGTGHLAIGEQTAKDKHLHVGSTVPVTFELTGHKQLTVGAIYKKNPIAGAYLIGMSTYDANFRNRLDMAIGVKAAPGAALGTLRKNLAAALKATPNLDLRDQSEFKQNQKHQINQLLKIVLALLVLSLIIAWLGIVNTLALSVFERTREIGLLRAVGMATRQVRRMVRLEAVAIAVFGALLGVVLGSGYGAALAQSLHSQGINSTSIPVVQLVVYLVVGVLAGVTAALWPAYRAGKLDVLQAISTE